MVENPTVKYDFTNCGMTKHEIRLSKLTQHDFVVIEY